ncbi:MAG: type II toxin-antitoxin system Phd/YefM family antitoxin [Isosphaeraceae bacterium]
MKIASVADVKAHFSEYLKESEKGAVVVTRNGRPVAVILGTEDEDEIERLILGHSKRLREILEAARRRIREGKGIPEDEFWRQVEAENAEASKPDHAPIEEKKRPGPKKPVAGKARGKRS